MMGSAKHLLFQTGTEILPLAVLKSMNRIDMNKKFGMTRVVFAPAQN